MRAGLVGASAALALFACGAPARTPSTPPKGSAHAGVPPAGTPYPASRVFPDVAETDRVLLPAPRRLAENDASRGPGDDRILDRMRVTFEKGGVMRRADDLLPIGAVSAVELPARLGGGFAITVLNARGTQVYRSDTWLSKLKPLVEVSLVADRDAPVIVGFDRLYLRLRTTDELVAFDPASGQPMPLGPLPIAPSFGEMVFVDGWRAVVDTELRGLLATFDAGATWRRVPISEHVKTLSLAAGNAVIGVDGGEYRLDDRGRLTFAPVDAVTASIDAPGPLQGAGSAHAPLAETPLGKRPLRAALEDGYADEGRTAVVARGGTLARVRLDDGSIAASKAHALSETAACHAIRLGPSFGFVCGEPTGRTLLYEFHSPLDAKLVASFDDARVVTESGQGVVVIEGSCSAKNTDAPLLLGAKGPASPRSFCVRSLDGTLREIRVRGDVGAERVVALADGRVAVLVPPREGSLGQLSIIDQGAAKRVTLKIPPEAPAHELESGMWLDGFQETAPGEIGGWVEAGGPYVGVRIKLDGTVTTGQLVEEDNGVLVSGLFGLALGTRGRALETVDGGLSWKDIVLPVAMPTGAVDATKVEARVRRCGPVGCALPGMLRVGWGDPAVPYDLSEAPDPPPLHVPLAKLAFAPLSIDCGPAASAPEPRPSRPPTRAKAPTSGQTPGGWASFRGVDPPELAADEVGIDNGQSYDATPLRAYVWGKKDADWSRTGRYLIRFSDPWTPSDALSSGLSQSLWADESSASLAFGLGSLGYATTWNALPDVRGGAAIVSACRATAACGLFAVEPERPVLALRPQRGLAAVSKLGEQSAVRVGETWFFIGEAGGHSGIFRADLGTIRMVREVSLAHTSRPTELVPELVRRSRGGGIGLAFVARLEPSDKKGERYVIPVDTETGDLGDPIDMGHNDLASLSPTPCQDERDGWLIDVRAADPAAVVTSAGAIFGVENTEVRLRLEPGFACIEAANAKADHPAPAPSSTAARERSPDATFPLVVSQLGGGPRTTLACTTRASSR